MKKVLKDFLKIRTEEKLKKKQTNLNWISLRNFSKKNLVHTTNYIYLRKANRWRKNLCKFKEKNAKRSKPKRK